MAFVHDSVPLSLVSIQPHALIEQAPAPPLVILDMCVKLEKHNKSSSIIQSTVHFDRVRHILHNCSVPILLHDISCVLIIQTYTLYKLYI